MQIWPGKPYPAGRDVRRSRNELFAVFRSWPSGSSCACSTITGRKRAIDLPETTALCWHGYLPNVRPGQRYGFRVHGPWAPEHGQWCNPAKLLLDPYAKAIDGRGTGTRRSSRTTSASPRTRRNDLDSAPFVAPSRRHQPVLRLGQRPAAEHAVAPDGRLRDARQGLHAACIPDIPEELRGTYAGLAHPGRDRVPAAARRHRGRAAAGAPVRAGLDAARAAGCATTGATTRSATSRRTTSTRAAGSAASRCRSSSSW